MPYELEMVFTVLYSMLISHRVTLRQESVLFLCFIGQYSLWYIPNKIIDNLLFQVSLDDLITVTWHDDVCRGESVDDESLSISSRSDSHPRQYRQIGSLRPSSLHWRRWSSRLYSAFISWILLSQVLVGILLCINESIIWYYYFNKIGKVSYK